jgi:hypothetical protein
MKLFPQSSSTIIASPQAELSATKYPLLPIYAQAQTALAINPQHLPSYLMRTSDQTDVPTLPYMIRLPLLLKNGKPLIRMKAQVVK